MSVSVVMGVQIRLLCEDCDARALTPVQQVRPVRAARLGVEKNSPQRRRGRRVGE
jgi:ribosomal protein L34E